MTDRTPRDRWDPAGRVELGRRGDVLDVRISGEVDLSLRDELHEALRAVRDHAGPVEIDLHAVTFFGGEGVDALLAMHEARPPGAVSIVGTSQAVERTLHASGIPDDALPRPRGRA